ncbi:glycosyl hydrolase family 28 protein [Enterococcus songbeiensis]
MTIKVYQPKDFRVAPATLTSRSLTLIWNKPDKYMDVVAYDIYQDGKLIGSTPYNKTHFSLRNLDTDTKYDFFIEAIIPQKNNNLKISSETLSCETKKESSVIDITDAPYYIEKEEIGTKILQQAINDCPKDGIVLIPEGTVVLSGAIELKSNMTLQIDGRLEGSKNPEDYRFNPAERKKYPGSVNEDGLILTRYEGWEMFCYRSLINVGYLNTKDRLETNCQNVRICGSGVIYGGGNELGLAMREIYADTQSYPLYLSDGRPGRRARGRLLSFIQAKNVHLTGVTVENPPSWTIHMIYCDTVTTHGIHIKSQGIDNGDGWDPDSSQNCMIFDTTFDTGDDCIAIKSGKNPDGNKINIPTKNISIFDLKMIGGHGMAIGSEQSGGVEGVMLRDCLIQNTMFGLEMKAHNDRGGYIKNVLIQDCIMDCFIAHSVPYNSDGNSASHLPNFSDISVKNSIINGSGRTIDIEGFSKENQKEYISNIFFDNVTIQSDPKDAKEILLKKCRNITFNNVRMEDGTHPVYNIEKETTNDIIIK